MANQTLNLTPELLQYLLNVSLRENKVLAELREETQRLPSRNMQIAPEQGQFMALLIELMQAKKILEIGTYTGYSALTLALALPENGEVHTCDVDKESTKIAQQYWQKAGVTKKITLHLAKASETLQKLIDDGQSQTFDFVFIDADKNNYDDYYEKSLILLRPGGLIAIDNVLWGGDVANPQIIDKTTNSLRSLNKKLLDDKRITLSLVPIADGLSLARKH